MPHCEAPLLCYFGDLIREVMVLTHFEAPVEDQMPYYHTRCAPVRPLVFVGRSAKFEPAVPARECEYMYMQDRPVLMI